MCDRCLCHKKYCVWPAKEAWQKSCDLCSFRKVICTISGGVRVCNRKIQSSAGKGKRSNKRVEESEAESEVSGAGPSGPSTLREEDKQTELLMGFKESFDHTNELLVELKESSERRNALIEQQNVLLGCMVRRFDAGLVNTDVDSTLRE